MSTTFLDAFDSKEAKQIISAGKRVTVPEGWSPISERTGADKCYIIESGEVSVRKNGEEINRLGPGDVMGEKAILDHSLRTASLVAVTRLEVIHFTDEAVRSLCEKMPKFKAELEKASAAHSR
jgi:CRP-like cAMP-binding protein